MGQWLGLVFERRGMIWHRPAAVGSILSESINGTGQQRTARASREKALPGPLLISVGGMAAAGEPRAGWSEALSAAIRPSHPSEPIRPSHPPSQSVRVSLGASRLAALLCGPDRGLIISAGPNA